MNEPLAPPWPTPLMKLDEYQSFREQWRNEMAAQSQRALERLEVMTDVVRKEHPGWQLVTQLFDMGSKVGVAAGLDGHYREATYVYVQGFTTDTLRKVARELVEKSKGNPRG